MTRVKETLTRWWGSVSNWLDQWAEYLEAEEIRQRQETLDRLERRDKRLQTLAKTPAEQSFGGKSII